MFSHSCSTGISYYFLLKYLFNNIFKFNVPVIVLLRKAVDMNLINYSLKFCLVFTVKTLLCFHYFIVALGNILFSVYAKLL